MCGFLRRRRLAVSIRLCSRANSTVTARCVLLPIFIQQQLIEVAKPGEDMSYPRIVLPSPRKVPDGQFTGQTVVRIARDNPDEQPDD